MVLLIEANLRQAEKHAKAGNQEKALHYYENAISLYHSYGF